MNMRRGLWRAWIFVTIPWLIGTVAAAYANLPHDVAQDYDFINIVRRDVDPNKIDWSKDFYALMQSPSKGKLPSTFDVLTYQYVARPCTHKTRWRAYRS